jgi:uroporphyrinogen-III synthase
MVSGMHVRSVMAQHDREFEKSFNLAACRTFIPGEAFAQNLSEFGAPQGKSCFANVVSTWTFAL